jgi:hypothetical protein
MPLDLLMGLGGGIHCLDAMVQRAWVARKGGFGVLSGAADIHIYLLESRIS